MNAPPAASNDSADTRRALRLVLLAALGLRALLAVGAWLAGHGAGVFRFPDSTNYLDLARAMAARGVFERNHLPEIVRTPGYPLLLLPGVVAGRVEAVTIALQTGISVGTVAGVFALARALGGSRRMALAAAAAFAVEPLSVIYAPLILTETAFTALLVWALCLAVLHGRTGRLPHLLGAVTLLAAAAYVRPVGYLLPFAVAGFFAAQAAARRRWSALPPAVLAAVMAAALLAPWQLRNRAAAGYGGFSAVSAQSMYFYNAAAVLAAHRGVPLQTQQRQMGWPSDEETYLRAHPAQRSWRRARRLDFIAAEGRRIVLRDPATFARAWAAGTARVLAGTGGAELQHLFAAEPREPLGRRLASARFTAADLLHLAAALPMLAIYAAAAWGAATLLRGRRDVLRPELVLLGGICAYLLVVPGPAGVARFRHPVMPLVCIAAGAGVADVLGRRARRGSPTVDHRTGGIP